MKLPALILYIILVPTLFACGMLPGTSGEQDSEQTTEIVAAENAAVDVSTETSQDQNVSSGAVVDADKVESITTENVTGIPVYWFIIAAIIFGMIIPQPRFIKWFW